MLIFGVPIRKPNVRALISWLISVPAGAGLTGFGCGPVGTHAAGAGFTGCGGGPVGTLPPPVKVTSWSSSSVDRVAHQVHAQSLEEEG